MANHEETGRSQVEVDQSYVSMIVPKNLPEGPNCFEVCNRAGLVQGQLAGLRLPVRIVLWPIVVQALVNPTMRPGLPVLCRAVSQIVGDITLVSVGEGVVCLTNSICMVSGLCARSVAGAVSGRGRGDILQCIEKIGVLVNAALVEFWTPRLQNFCPSHPEQQHLACIGRCLRVVDELCVHFARVTHRRACPPSYQGFVQELEAMQYVCAAIVCSCWHNASMPTVFTKITNTESQRCFQLTIDVFCEEFSKSRD